MHKIKMPNDSSSDCFDSIAYSMLKYHDFDYEAYNIKYFYTDYYCSSDNCIIRGKTQNDVLKKIYNIDLISNDKDDQFDLSENITDLIDRVPVGVFIDLYYCPWSPFYNKAYFSHCLLIVDVDYKNKKYLCFDVYFDKIGYVEVDMDIILQHYESCFVFDFGKTKEVKLEFLLDRIYDSIYNYDNNTSKKVLDMVNFFTSNNIKVLSSEDIETSINIVNLMGIVEDRKHFSIALRYIERKTGKAAFTPICELLTKSENTLSILVSIIIKCAMTGIIKEDKLKNIINQIFIIDDLIVERMKTVLNKFFGF